MAGVPAIMRAMFDMLAPRLQGGTPVVSRSVHAADMREGDIAAGLSAIQARYPALDLGSYPYYRDTGGGVAIVAKGLDAEAAEAAIAEVTVLFSGLGGKPSAGSRRRRWSEARWNDVIPRGMLWYRDVAAARFT